MPKKPEERVEKSGRKARGRKPGASKPRKQSQPKPLSSVRDKKVNSLAQVIKDNIGSLPEIVQILSGYAGVILKFTLGQRYDMLVKFAAVLGLKID